ncbi:MAG: hypothetical protein EWV76_19005 [Microcystis novacekii Mn_MB_F_20050700_S1]|uniref:Mobile element protein n=1 Tax=Microcystis novacekii Mn_MB_F_20050700_S1D TaxID=2486266 RepID=A0A552J606_9CHRO|nr:MAG: hypothetical protein EWV76_19005 [Microcystis novacekii Mn_MB_F_20050700_S1]TRU91180.1 MAG: hypothetical protein EWV54_05300 [Microcystis novacekii Mn_MB_F_20050700_S1D]
MSDYPVGTSYFCKSTELGFLKGNYLLKLVITSDFITQSKPLGGRTPQTPRWGRGAAPKPPAH